MEFGSWLNGYPSSTKGFALQESATPGLQNCYPLVRVHMWRISSVQSTRSFQLVPKRVKCVSVLLSGATFLVMLEREANGKSKIYGGVPLF